MIPFGIVKYDRLIMGLQVQEERAARRLAYHLTHVGSMAFGIFYDQRCRFMKACQAQATGSAGFNATKTQRHQETSMNITRHQTKAAFFLKTLGQCPSPNIIHPGNPSGGTYMCGSFGRIIGGQLLVRC